MINICLNRNKRPKTLLTLIISGFLIIYYATLASGQQFNFTLDFETGDLKGWEKTGNAFKYQPTLNDNPTARHRGQPSNHRDRYWIGTYEKYQGRHGQEPGMIQGDRPQGTLTSSSFTIPRGSLSFLVGGGSGFQTRVEFFVQDPVEGSIRVFHVSGRNTETMHSVEWDLTPYAGKTGRIRIVDKSSKGWGHINVDDFKFSTFPGSGGLLTPESPRAKINPSHRGVIQGERALFRSRSTPARGLIESWKGPGDHSGRGRSFTVFTDNLQPGHYDITLEITDNEGHGDSKVAILEVLSPPVRYRIEVRANMAIAEEGRGVRFNAILTPEVPGAEYRFLFGDGIESNWSTSLRIEHAYESRGLYRVIVMAREDREIIAESSPLEIEVNPRMVYRVILEANKENPYPGERVRFVGDLQPGRDGVEYRFDFGDGRRTRWMVFNESDHEYESAGSYRILVEARAEREILGSSRPLLIEVKERPPGPKAIINPQRIEVIKGEKAVFESRSTPEGLIRQNWSGPGEQGGTGHTFELRTDRLSPGEYDIFLEIMDEWEQGDHAKAVLEVKALPPKPVAKIFPEHRSVVKGMRALYQSQSTLERLIEENWTGPGGQTGTGRTFDIRTDQLSPGEYEIVLEIKDRLEQSDEAKATIEVKPPPSPKPVAKIKPGSIEVTRGERANFKSRSTPEGQIIESWEGPGGQIGEGRIFEVQTDQLVPGRYEIVLKVNDDQGQSDRTIAILQVSDVIPATPTPTPTPQKPPHEPDQSFWGWIIAGLLILSGVSYYFFLRPKAILQVRPHKTLGTQEIEWETSFEPSLEVRLRPMSDHGEQEIESEGPLLSSEERREDGS